MPTFVSCFSGAGGLDLGVAAAGGRPVAAGDTDAHAVATYNAIHRVRDPEWAEAAGRMSGHQAQVADAVDLLKAGAYPHADLVVGGPPCQGFSRAGRRDPNDPRSAHVHTFFDIVDVVRPRAFIMENVADLARHAGWAGVREELIARAESGYRVDLVVENATRWGVAQRRERMFLIGTPTGSGGPRWPERDTHAPTVRDVLSGLPAAGTPGNPLTSTAAIVPAKNPVLRRSPFAGMLFNGMGRAIDLDAPSPTLPASMGGNKTPIIDEGHLAGKQPWIVGYHAHLQRGGAGLEVPPRLRRMTVTEAAALQSFPPDMPWSGPISAQYRQIGNAVPPRMARGVAAAVIAAL